MLIVFGGLPGTGKTTLARALSQRLGATYLRIDTIEQALRTTGMLPDDMKDAGYVVAYALAREEFRLGKTVVADCVNPIARTRNAWRAVAESSASAILEVEVVCSDPKRHRERVETREADILGLVLPTWRQVVEREYEPWNRPHHVIDTAIRTKSSAIEELLALVWP